MTSWRTTGCRPLDDRSPEKRLAMRTTKSGEPVEADDLAAVTVLPSVCFPAVIRASVMTCAGSLRAAVDLSPEVARSVPVLCCRRRGTPARRTDCGTHGCTLRPPGCCSGCGRDRRLAQPQIDPRSRHDLHQAHRVLFRPGPRFAAAFDAHDYAYPMLRHT